jgi:ribosomal protein S8E
LVLASASLYEQELQNSYIIYAQKESDRYGDKPHNFDIDKKDKSVYQKFSFGRIDDPSDNSQLPELKRLLEPLKFFGEKFHDRVFNEVNADIDKEREVKAFQEIFAIRNLIAHQTYVEFNTGSIRNKTFMDIKQLHDDAVKFVNYLISHFT